MARSRKENLLVSAFYPLFYHSGGMIMMFVMSILEIRRLPRSLKRFMNQLYEVGVNTLPLALMIGLFTGMIVALQTGSELKKMNIQQFVGGIVGLSMIREMGPVITSFIVTGRVGAAMAAELGTMAVSEEVDALRSLGINPIGYLVMPRFLATLLMLPILMIFSTFVGLWGGGMISDSYLGVTSNIYFDQLYSTVGMIDIITGVSKTFIFAAIFSIVCCYMGFEAKNGAQGVGKNTMLALVVSLTMILVADFFVNRFLG